MDKRRIICISREYGSGGRVVGETLAQQLGIICYDKKLLAKTALEHGVSEEAVESADEKPVSWSSMGFPMGLRNPYQIDYDAMFYIINDRIYQMQAQTIKAIAAEGSCVIIGRVAEFILKDDPDMISIFIHARKEDRIQRVMETEKLDAQKAAQLIRKIDKDRASYHNTYSDDKWGQCSSYDLAISTSKFGIDGAVKAILKLLA
ncbi:MAG: cytidylate kinase-like family protein [Clostridiaceae bacterium]|nr:cytidylate kinase-like family protein [Clostridiaceae bacterium]